MKIEIPQKVVLNIMQSRLVEISETLDHEAQCGFRPMRGCIDVIFNFRIELRKGQDCNMETRVFILVFAKLSIVFQGKCYGFAFDGLRAFAIDR